MITTTVRRAVRRSAGGILADGATVPVKPAAAAARTRVSPPVAALRDLYAALRVSVNRITQLSLKHGDVLEVTMMR